MAIIVKNLSAKRLYYILNNNEYIFIVIEGVDDAMAAMVDGEVEAVVYDAPSLL
jgi:hypothetical protein